MKTRVDIHQFSKDPKHRKDVTRAIENLINMGWRILSTTVDTETILIIFAKEENKGKPYERR